VRPIILRELFAETLSSESFGVFICPVFSVIAIGRDETGATGREKISREIFSREAFPEKNLT